MHFEDMGKKTVGNDLDNASIGFENVALPKDALLNRFADIEGDEYVQKVRLLAHPLSGALLPAWSCCDAK